MSQNFPLDRNRSPWDMPKEFKQLLKAIAYHWFSDCLTLLELLDVQSEDLPDLLAKISFSKLDTARPN